MYVDDCCEGFILAPPDLDMSDSEEEQEWGDFSGSFWEWFGRQFDLVGVFLRVNASKRDSAFLSDTKSTRASKSVFPLMTTHHLSCSI